MRVECVDCGDLLDSDDAIFGVPPTEEEGEWFNEEDRPKDGKVWLCSYCHKQSCLDR